MPKGKSAAPAAASEATETPSEDVVIASPVIVPFATPRRPAIYKQMTGEPGSQFAGLWLETQSNLLGVEIRVLGSLTYWADIHVALAPYIRSWNIQGPHEVMVTRPAVLHSDGTTILVPERQVAEIEWRVLPAPMVAGPEVFESIDQLTKVWIWNQVRTAPYKQDADLGKS